MSPLRIVEVQDADLPDTWPVMSQLRPHLKEVDYLAMVRRMRATYGFRMFAASRVGSVVGVAGVRPMELLYCEGRSRSSGAFRGVSGFRAHA